jgi:hypothetical protein
MNPYSYRAGDESMKKDKAANYIAPNKRKEMGDYLSKVPVWVPQKTTEIRRSNNSLNFVTHWINSQ